MKIATGVACFLGLALIPTTSAGQIQLPLESPKHWRRLHRASPDAGIELHIVLGARNGESDVERALFDVATPSSKRFRQHLTAQEAAALVSPDDEAVKSVAEWLDEHSIPFKQRGDVISASTNINRAEKLLNASYFLYSDGSQEVIRTCDFSLPIHLKSHLKFITPTTQFPPPSRRVDVRQFGSSQGLRKRDNCGASDLVTPSCIAQAYNITRKPEPNRTTFAVYGTEAASFSPNDLQTFLSRYRPEASGATFDVVGSGDPAEGSGGIGSAFETALDTQTSLGTAWPAAGIFYNNGGVFGPSPANSTYDRFVSFLTDLIHNETVPSVVSFSESMPEAHLDAAYARRLCDMLGQAGARGISLLFSSGDNGPNGDQPSGRHDAVFEPEFPASCPYVTAVGGTTNLAAETAATAQTMNGGGLGYYASGGGFSNLFDRPAYQRAVADAYVRDHVPASYATEPGFNGAGRGIPDVSAFSANVPVVLGLLSVGIGGTSASTPLWAAVVAVLNDYEASRGRPALGFLNPWLYGLKEKGLKDITTGGNSKGQCYLLLGCTLDKTLGYDVADGWDAVTGLGSPVVSQLMEALDEAAAAYSL